MLYDLLWRGIKIEMMLNDDGINQRYLDQINYLNSQGAKIQLVRYGRIMHHKFCKIDN